MSYQPHAKAEATAGQTPARRDLDKIDPMERTDISRIYLTNPNPNRTSRTRTNHYPSREAQPTESVSLHRPNQPLNVSDLLNATTLPVAVPRLPESGRHATPCEVRRRSPQPPRKPAP
jgi:hypothetical protein